MKKSPELAENNIKKISNFARKGFDDVRKTIHHFRIRKFDVSSRL